MSMLEQPAPALLIPPPAKFKRKKSGKADYFHQKFKIHTIPNLIENQTLADSDSSHDALSHEAVIF